MDFSIQEIIEVTKGRGQNISALNLRLNHVYTDTRMIYEPGGVFIALKTDKRDGTEFIDVAFEKGCELTIVHKGFTSEYPSIEVEDTYEALMLIAQAHRGKFNIPVVLITGDKGKTSVKEYAWDMLQSFYEVLRTPKSFNSPLGVAKTLLQITKSTEVAIVEVGVDAQFSNAFLKEVVQPSLGLLTDDALSEKREGLLPDNRVLFDLKGFKTFINGLKHLKRLSNFQLRNIYLAYGLAQKFVQNYALPENYHPPILSLRTALFEKEDGGKLLVDIYDIHASEIKELVTNYNSAFLIVGWNPNWSESEFVEVQQLLDNRPGIFIGPKEKGGTSIEVFLDELHDIQQKDILLLGSKKYGIGAIADALRKKKHNTVLEVNKANVRYNLNVLLREGKPSKGIIPMIKANAYGAGLLEMASFYQAEGVTYVGVAYADEGVYLRKNGITCRILVMNADPAVFDDCIQHNLDLAIGGKWVLNSFLDKAVEKGLNAFPIHIKLNTGMNRMGFDLSELSWVVQNINSQPEVKVSSVFSHFSRAEEGEFSKEQLRSFEEGVNVLRRGLPYTFDIHIGNSMGVLNHYATTEDYIRSGIALYGIGDAELKFSLRLSSRVINVREIEKGQSVGYGTSFCASNPMKIAVLSLGYEEILPYNIENACVYFQGKSLPLIGKPCMDTCFVDVTNVSIEEGDEVVIFENEEQLNSLAAAANTISYEILTRMSNRIHRVYLD